MSKFSSYHNSAILMTFDNGYTISITWKPMTYSNHHDFPGDRDSTFGTEKFKMWVEAPSNKKNLARGWHSSTAEVAVWTTNSDGTRNWKDIDSLSDAYWNGKPCTDTKGWQNTNDVAELIHTVSKIKVKGNKLWDKIPWTN